MRWFERMTEFRSKWKIPCWGRAIGSFSMLALLPLSLSEGGEVLELGPDTFRSKLRRLSGQERLLVDLTPFASFRSLFEDAALRVSAKDASIHWALMDCMKHMSMCDSALGVEAWNGLRLYHAGDKPAAHGHVEIPIAAFIAEDHEGNIQRLLSLVSDSRGKGGASALAKEWAAEARRQWEAKEEKSEEEDWNGIEKPVHFTRITDKSFEHVLGRVHQDPGHQVFILYHGSLNPCIDQREEISSAFDNLSVTARKKVTLGLVNCDLHSKPCEAASLAQYCIAAQHVASNTCRGTFGPVGSAVYRGELEREGILAAMKSKLPGAIVNQQTTTPSPPTPALEALGHGDEL